MVENIQKKKNVPLSASRISTLLKCSWQYYCNYVLKLPDTSNSGSVMGSAVHNVYEFLGNPRHKHLYNQLKEGQTMASCPPVERYILSYVRKQGYDPDSFTVSAHKEDITLRDLLCRMLIEGINYDFFGGVIQEPTEGHSEISFDIDKQEGEVDYRMRGFIDKLFLFKKETTAVIRDFKSSKRMFEGKEADDNIQDLMYKLAVKNLYPDYIKRKMEFVFLQFDCETRESTGVLQTASTCDDELYGLELFLTEIQKVVNNFDERAGKSNFAFDKGYLDNYEGFGGRVMCGRGDYPTHLKKDGNLMWKCGNKLAHLYYVLLNEEGGIIKSEMKRKDLPKAKKGQKIEKRAYLGCSKFDFLPYNKEFAEKHKDLS